MKQSQERYAADIVQRAGMGHCKPINTPLSNTEKLSATEPRETNLGLKTQQSTEAYSGGITVSHSNKTGYLFLCEQGLSVSPCADHSPLECYEEDTAVCARLSQYGT